MGNKVRVRARQTRSSGEVSPEERIREILIENYDETKGMYGELDEGMQARFDEIMGAELTEGFKESVMMAELQMNAMSDLGERFEKLNKLLEEIEENEQ